MPTTTVVYSTLLMVKVLTSKNEMILPVWLLQFQLSSCTVRGELEMVLFSQPNKLIHQSESDSSARPHILQLF